jgi:hypothetical protein
MKTSLYKLLVLKVAKIVAECLAEKKIDAVLVGGSCVSIYCKNKYQSYDLDFVTESHSKDVEIALINYGFIKKTERMFIHPKTHFVIDVIAPPATIGKKHIKNFANMGFLKLLTPTDCIKDRLLGYFHWGDVRSLEQAVMVAKAQNKKINFKELEKWSDNQGEINKYLIFIEKIRTTKQ